MISAGQGGRRGLTGVSQKKTTQQCANQTNELVLILVWFDIKL